MKMRFISKDGVNPNREFNDNIYTSKELTKYINKLKGLSN